MLETFLYIYLPSLHGYDVQFPYDRRTYSPTNFSFRVLLNLGLVPKGMSTRGARRDTIWGCIHTFSARYVTVYIVTPASSKQ